VSGRQLAGALAAIALLAGVLPPFAARQVHQRRLAHAQADVRRIADLLAAGDGAEMTAAGAGPAGQPVLLLGPGEAPKFSPDTHWPEARNLFDLSRADRDAPLALSPDPWGNALLIVVRAGKDRRVEVLSAGPNGFVDSRFPPGGSPTGDDIAAVAARSERPRASLH
jgi:hypothetical protein